MATRKSKRSSKKGAAKSAPFSSPFARAPKRAIPRKQMGESFGRRVVPTTVKANIDSSESWRRWAQSRGGRSVDRSLQNRRRMVVKLLTARGVEHDVAEEIAAMDPDKLYFVEIWGPRGSDPNGEIYEEPVKQATIIGTGAQCWQRLIGYATVAPISFVVIKELAAAQDKRFVTQDGAPLWDGESVVTVDGERVYGHGFLSEYRDRQKVGRKKKSGGGMTAGQRRKSRKSKREAIKRKQATAARIKQLKKTDPQAAKRLQAKSKRHRKVIP